MLQRSATFVALLTLGACGGDGGTNPPPPQVNRVASVTAVDTSILQFTGKKVALSKLFVAKDAAGAVVPGVFLSCVTPAGFALTGDSLVAPTAEARGKLRCSATTITHMLAPAAAPQRTDPVPDPVDSMTVTAGIDLRAYTWRAAWKCDGGGPTTGWHVNGTDVGRVDSLALDGRATFIYPDAAEFVQNWGGTAQVSVWSGTIQMYRSGAVVYNSALEIQTPEAVLSQDVNAINFRSGSLVLVNAAPRRYVGGSWCDSFGALPLPIGPVTLEEVAP